MTNILEQLGITKEEMIERIVNKALGITADYRQTGEDSWDDLPLSEVVDKKISDALGNMVEALKPKLQDRIDTIMDEKINQVFTQPFQPVTRWGESAGAPTTIKDIIANDAQNYWTTYVDSSGEPRERHWNGCKTRASYYAGKVMEDVYNRELKEEVQKMARELKARIPATISEEITKTVLAHLK